MPAVVVKKGTRYVVLSHRGGKILGSHPTRAKAISQMQAINISLHRKGKI